jgi:hypothetical protein
MLPGRIVSDATFFMNFGHRILGPSMWGGDFSINRNLVDPAIIYSQKALVDQRVNNPFFNVLPLDKFPGNLRNQQQVAARELLRPYPQYGNLTERLTPDRFNRYYAFQLKLERSFANGLSMLLGYNYNREYRAEWFNDIDQYANRYSLFDTRDPRHNVRIAGTYELPFGRGRTYLANLNRLADAVIGGWRTSHIFMFNNGAMVTFGALQVSGDPKISDPGPSRWFDTSKFALLPAYTPRTNPWYYEGLRGPGFWQLDSTISKDFMITEKHKLELRLEMFNATNHFIPNGPVTGVTSSQFGRSNWIFPGNYGREVQYMLRYAF